MFAIWKEGRKEVGVGSDSFMPLYRPEGLELIDILFFYFALGFIWLRSYYVLEDDITTQSSLRYIAICKNFCSRTEHCTDGRIYSA